MRSFFESYKFRFEVLKKITYIPGTWVLRRRFSCGELSLTCGAENDVAIAIFGVATASWDISENHGIGFRETKT